MPTSTPTKRERLMALLEESRTLLDVARERDLTEDEKAKVASNDAEQGALLEAMKVEAAANGTVDLVKAFLGQSDTGAPATPEVDSKSGIVNPRGMTLGEAFIKSPAYAEFIDQYKGADGRIREARNIKSAEFDLRSFEDFRAKTLVTGASSTSGGAFVEPYRYPVVTDLIGARETTLRDLCTNIRISTDVFEYVRITTRTNNAAAVAEATTSNDPASYGDPASGAKPESALALAVVSAPVETIAHLIPITRRAAADAPQVMDLINKFLFEGLDEEVEDQILNGDGNTPNVEGILQNNDISTVGSAGTDLDAVVDGIRTVRADRRRPTGMVVHPNDWYSTGFLLAKNTAGNYIVGDPRASIDQLNMLWGLNVVVTEAMTENTLLIGDFRQCVVADRQQNTIYVTDSHKDWFGRNLLAVLAETRLAVGLLDPDAFVTVTAV